MFDFDVPVGHVPTASGPLPMGQDPTEVPQPSQPNTLTPAQIENIQHQITSLLYQ